MHCPQAQHDRYVPNCPFAAARRSNVTTVYYDRILVMDAGRVAEFDSPLNLFDTEGSIFRSLCEEAGITRQDIVRIRASVNASI